MPAGALSFQIPPDERITMSETDFHETLHWTPQARAKLKNVPFFARAQARKRIEQLARASEDGTVTVELVERARTESGQ